MTVTTVKADSKGWTWHDLLWLVLALGVAVGVRATHLDSVPTFDEMWHLRLSAAKGVPLAIYEPDRLYLDPPLPTSLLGAPPIWRVWTSMDGVLHPPLYVLALRLWREVWGESNLAAHAFSIFWSAIAVGFTFAAARLAMGRVVAGLVALAMSLSPTQVYFGQEIRAYAMVIALVSIGIWLMTRIELLGPTRRRAIGLAILTLLMLLTHYFSIGAAVGFVIFGMISLRGHRKAFCFALACVAVVFAVTWVPFALQQIDDLGSGDASWRTPSREWWAESGYFLTAPWRVIADARQNQQSSAAIMGLLFVLPWFLSARQRALRPWVIVLVSTLGALFALDMARSTRVMSVTRYLAPISPAVFLLLAGCCMASRRWMGIVMMGSTCILGIVFLHARTGAPADMQSSESIVRYLQLHAAPGDSIVVFNGDPSSFYADAILMACSNTPGLDKRIYANLSRPMSPDAVTQLPPRWWLVCRSQADDPALIAPGMVAVKSKVIELDMVVHHMQRTAVSTEQIYVR